MPDPTLPELSWADARRWLRAAIVLAAKVGGAFWLLFSLFVLLGMPGPYLWFGSDNPLRDSAQAGLFIFAVVFATGLIGYLILLLVALAGRLFTRR